MIPPKIFDSTPCHDLTMMSLSKNCSWHLCRQCDTVPSMLHATGLWHIQPKSVHIFNRKQQSAAQQVIVVRRQLAISQVTVALLQCAVPWATLILLQHAALSLLLVQHIAHSGANSSSATTVFPPCVMCFQVCVHLSVHGVCYAHLPSWFPLPS